MAVPSLLRSNVPAPVQATTSSNAFSLKQAPTVPTAVPAPVKAAASISLKTFSLSYPFEYAAEKRDTLNRIRRGGVRRLVCVNCHTDPAWVLELLKAAAPSVTHLNLWHPRPEHLALLRTMRQLKRLDLGNDYPHDVLYDTSTNSGVIDFSVPQGQGLTRLRIRGDRGLPRDMFKALLQAHSASLENLKLQVGTPGQEADMVYAWPGKCNDLHILLRDCLLKALKKLYLDRAAEDAANDHNVRACERQLKKLENVLPRRVDVTCGSQECEAESSESEDESEDEFGKY